ncbi:SPOCS domain-containing protein [Zhaonella formicivorans]|uniref:SPOCS domain-containing protein n=1 Tax=Zhaonella formicivorans TaxID=2528593 RepID=UPI0010E29AA5|nr:SPOCS domain-containing protein [Zhaonella formicivorans]
MAVNLKLVKKRVQVETVVGEYTSQVTLKGELTFPVEVKKIKDVHAEITNLAAKPLKDKLLIEGKLHKQVTWVPEAGGRHDGVEYEAGGVYDLPVVETFSHFMDFSGCTPECAVTVDARVEFVDQAEKTEGGDDSPTVWRQDVTIELFVRVSRVSNAHVITDVLAPGMALNIVKDKCIVESVVGQASKQVKAVADIEFPREVAKIKVVQAKVKDIATEVVADRIEVSGQLHQQIFYIEEGTGRMFETSVDEEWTAPIELPGARPGMDVTADAMVECAEVELKPDIKNQARRTAIIKIAVKAMADLPLEFVKDVTGPNIRTVKGVLKCENVVGSATSQVDIQRDITFQQPVKKIMSADAKVKFKRKDTRVVPDQVVVEGILHKQIFFVGLCDDAVWEKSLDEPFSTFVDIPGAQPGMNVAVKGRVENVDLIPPDYPEKCCENFEPEKYSWDQAAVVEVKAKVTQTREIGIILDVTGEAAVLPAEEYVRAVVDRPSIRFYKIQPGDTFWKLAERYGTTVEAIMELNPCLDPQNLQIGTIMKIPCGVPGAVSPQSSVISRQQF